jgi:2-hydroxy-3-keto-5-methylthiopentenyl-1-phosphate phosphatase
MVKKVRLTKKCKPAMQLLKERGVKLVLVSGGIDSFLRAAFSDYHEGTSKNKRFSELLRT